MENFAHKLSGLLDEKAPIVFFQDGFFRISSVVVTTWIIMAILFIAIFILTRKLSKVPTTKRQVIAENIVGWFRSFAVDLVGPKGMQMAGTLAAIFITIFMMNFIWFIPILESPTASYSTTAALAIVGFIYSQFVIVKNKGAGAYLKGYFQPLGFMVIFNVIDLFTRPLSLSVRLFGNLFTGGILVGVLYAIMPFLLPLPIHFLELLTGTIQAYVFALLIGIYASEGLEEE